MGEDAQDGAAVEAVQLGVEVAVRPVDDDLVGVREAALGDEDRTSDGMARDYNVWGRYTYTVGG